MVGCIHVYLQVELQQASANFTIATRWTFTCGFIRLCRSNINVVCKSKVFKVLMCWFFGWFSFWDRDMFLTAVAARRNPLTKMSTTASTISHHRPLFWMLSGDGQIRIRGTKWAILQMMMPARTAFSLLVTPQPAKQGGNFLRFFEWINDWQPKFIEEMIGISVYLEMNLGFDSECVASFLYTWP